MRPRTIALVCVWTLPSVILLAVTALVYGAFHIPEGERLDEKDRAAALACAHAALESRFAPCAVHHRIDGMLAITVWLEGRAIARVDGYGEDVATALDAAAKLLPTQKQIQPLSTIARQAARVQIDIVAGQAPIAGKSVLFDALAVPGIADMLAINAGVDGIGAMVGDKPVYLLPHELVGAKLLSTKRPSQAMPDLAMGMDTQRIQAMLATRGGQPGVKDLALFRFHTDAFVDGPHGSLPLYRGAPPRPALTAKSLRDAALLGGRYLVSHLGANGRYVYEHDVATGTQTDPLRSTNYSMPRHAGTTYFLAQLYRITKEEWLREPIERAFKHLADLLAVGNCGGTLPDGTAYDCVLDKTESVSQLGSTALAVVALAEYQRATGDTRYLALAKQLSAFVLWMQRPDGSFRHLYDAKARKPDDDSQLLYYSGEATLALARMWTVTGDERYGKAAERGLDWLVDWYDFFMGGFFFGEEHWTCISAEAIWPYAKRDKYRTFCDDYGTFLRGQQVQPGEMDDEGDWEGAYNVTPFVTPFNTPAGSRTEAMISAYLLDRAHGEENAPLREQIEGTLGYLLGQQIRPENDFAVIGSADGGMTGSPIDRTVRIDFVQHVCSAMIRASEWIQR